MGIVEDWNLQVGSEVVYVGGGFRGSRSIAKVVNITPSGMVDVDIGGLRNIRFNKEGELLGAKSSRPLYLMQLTPELKARIELENLQAKVDNLLKQLDTKKLPKDQLQLIELLLSQPERLSSDCCEALTEAYWNKCEM